MLTKIRNSLMLAMVVVFSAVSSVEAAGIPVVTPDNLFNQLRGIVNTVITPLGAFLIFISICFAGFKLIMTANKPQDRSEVLASLPYIAGGGIILGSVLLLTGFIIGLIPTP